LMEFTMSNAICFFPLERESPLNIN